MIRPHHKTGKPTGAKAHHVMLSESHIEQTCTAWLELDGWRSLKTDPVSRREWGKGFGELGMADRLYIRYRDIFAVADMTACKRLLPALADLETLAQVLWIEWKTPTGAVKPHQADWHHAERNRGAMTLIAGMNFPASIEGFQNWYRESGLMRRDLR